MFIYSSTIILNLFKINNVRTSNICKRTFFRSPVGNLFWESDIKGGYKSKDVPSRLKLIKDGFKELKHEFKLFKQEIVEKFESDPILVFPPGTVDIQWKINNKQHLNQWIVTCDSDHGEGFSTCDFSINSSGFGLFSGNLCTQVPKDGVIRRAGYCSIRTIRKRKSFKRDDFFNWNHYTHIVIRCRGDGRSYMLNIATSGYFDQLWNDIYHYVLFTRGGPYWQVTKIPFSKFFFANKGRVQDKQSRIPLNKVSHFGITASDKINGPFSLEIDYIGLEFDPVYNEEFAYEMYRTDRNIAAN